MHVTLQDDFVSACSHTIWIVGILINLCSFVIPFHWCHHITCQCGLWLEHTLYLIYISILLLTYLYLFWWYVAPFQSIETSLRLLHAFAESVLTNTNPNNILNNTSAYLDQVRSVSTTTDRSMVDYLFLSACVGERSSVYAADHRIESSE